MKNKVGFDNKKYLKIQKDEILKRIKAFDNKLYLEVGGKLFDDLHASRVLPGFEVDSKMQLLLTLKDKTEIIVVVNTADIQSNRIRGDLNITYVDEVDRLIDAFKERGFSVNSVVLSFYKPTQEVDEFIANMTNHGIHVYKHYEINGYPQNIPLIVSQDGLGKNEYVKTTKPLVVVTAPGPGSGKMATCLSQLYHDNKNGINSGYAKYETFPVWNLPLNHPVNYAYEAATCDLNDINMIDPFHLEAYGLTAVNYNRDIEVFPLLKAIFEKIYKTSIYKSPTDMGVNMLGFAIKDDSVVQQAAKNEIIRRYYETKKSIYIGKLKEDSLNKIEMSMHSLGISIRDRKCVAAANKKYEQTGEICVAIELGNKKIVTGKRSVLFGAPAALLLNSLKTLAKIDDSIPLLSRSIITPLSDLKINSLHNNNPRIHAGEILIALAIQANSNPLAELALKQLPKLKGLQAHSSHILPDDDLKTFKKIGIDITEEPKLYSKKFNF